eukprot:3778670-Rhodomonas_salina.4
MLSLNAIFVSAPGVPYMEVSNPSTLVCTAPYRRFVGVGSRSCGGAEMGRLRIERVKALIPALWLYGSVRLPFFRCIGLRCGSGVFSTGGRLLAAEESGRNLRAAL